MVVVVVVWAPHCHWLMVVVPFVGDCSWPFVVGVGVWWWCSCRHVGGAGHSSSFVGGAAGCLTLVVHVVIGCQSLLVFGCHLCPFVGTGCRLWAVVGGGSGPWFVFLGVAAVFVCWPSFVFILGGLSLFLGGHEQSSLMVVCWH